MKLKMFYLKPELIQNLLWQNLLCVIVYHVVFKVFYAKLAF